MKSPKVSLSVLLWRFFVGSILGSFGDLGGAFEGSVGGIRREHVGRRLGKAVTSNTKTLISTLEAITFIT